MARAQNILRPRLAAFAGRLQIGQGFAPAVILEQHQAIIVIGLQMSLVSGFLVPSFRLAQIQRNTAAQFIGLRQIELCVRIALLGRSAPFVDSGLKIAASSCVNASLHIRHGRCGNQEERQAKQRSYGMIGFFHGIFLGAQ